MSVMQCDRNGCDNIMCNRISGDYGYICNDCFAELCSITRSLSGTRIMEFMKSEKQPSVIKETAREYLEKVFRGID